MNNQLLFKMLEGQNIDNKYYLKRLLGSGGFGGVYLADEVVKDRFIRELAVKLIITDNPDKQLDELIFSTTLKHPNLLDCYTCGECTLNNFEFLYLLMEKADYSLEDELKKGQLSEEKVKPLVLDIVNGLNYLHSQKPTIVHRDLKPGNILRVGDKWKISDFGLVKSVQNNSAKTTTMIGSMGYAPPEAYQGKISSAWDIWSLGVVIYEVLMGELPFHSDTPLALMQQVVNEKYNINNVPNDWQLIVKKCLEKEDKQRFNSQQILDIILVNYNKNNITNTRQSKNSVSRLNQNLKIKQKYQSLKLSQNKENKLLFLYLFVIFSLLLITMYFIKIHFNLVNIGNSLFISWLIVLTIINCKTMELPNTLTQSGLLTGLIFQSLIGYTQNDFPGLIEFLYNSIVGAVIGIWVSDIIRILSTVMVGKPAVGGGASKLNSMIGSWLGWISVLHTGLICLISGTVFGCICIMFKILKKGEPQPVAPYLFIGAVYTLFYGNNIPYFMKIIHIFFS